MSYVPSHRNQNYLIPPNITDLFPKDHVCYLIEWLTDDIDYSEFDELYGGAGRPAYHPRIIIKLLLMGYIEGIRSGRRIAKNSYENVVYIYLAEKVNPDFRTITDFRKNNKDLVKMIFKQISKFAYEKGLIDLNHLMTDGTIIQANTNNDRTLDKANIEKINKYIDKIIDEGIKIDEEEDKKYGNRGMHQLPEEFKEAEKRKPIIRKIVNEINQSIKEGKKEHVKEIKSTLVKIYDKLEKENSKLLSLDDKDAKMMLSKKGRKELSYNAQIVTERNGLIVANDVVQDCDDYNQLVPNINNVEENFGTLPKGTIVSADGGYAKGKQMGNLNNRGFDLYLPMRGTSPEHDVKKFAKAKFSYDKEKDAYICPENKLLMNRGKSIHSQSKEEMTIYSTCKKDCIDCPNKLECCKKSHTKRIHATPYEKLFMQIAKKMQTDEGQLIYDLRKQTVERSFGDIRNNKWFRRFGLKGLDKVKTEFNLACTAHNLVLINNLIHNKTERKAYKNKSVLGILVAAC